MAYNAGFLIWFLFANFALIVPFFVIWVCSKKCTCCKKLETNMNNYLFCNGILRLLIQSFFEIFLLSSLNVYTVDTEAEDGDTIYSYWLAYAMCVLCIALLVFLPCAYKRKEKKWTDPNFDARFGAYLTDVNVEYKGRTKWTVLFHPILFLFRRIVFVWSVLIMREYVVFQIFIQMYLSLFVIAYFLHWRPLIDPATHRIEIFNEYFAILSTYSLLLFTNFI